MGNFRDQLIAAPLKRILPAPRRAEAWDFRDQLIAAPLKQHYPVEVLAAVGHFRDQLIAAPLKPGTQDGHQLPHGRFPRSADRGPIEAGGPFQSRITDCGEIFSTSAISSM